MIEASLPPALTGGQGGRGPILLVCGSRKPAPGRTSPSAARQFLRVVEQALNDQGAPHEWLDLRDLDLPLFDGRACSDYESPDLDRAAATVARAGVILMSVPAYWGGPAGAIKNFIDVIGGPAYDAPAGSALPLQGKVIALLIVGADALSAYGALASMRLTLGSAGAWTAPRAQVIPNPREVRDAGRLLAALKGFAGYVASLAQAAAPVR